MARPRNPRPSAAPVKSALRVLELLDYFATVRRPSSVSEIARALGYPQSSTSMLVSTLIEQGYLAEGADRTVAPSVRVALLGRWVDARVTDGRIHRLMQDLGQETGETILLGIPGDTSAIYVDAVPATNPMRLHIPPGTTRPIEASGVGLMLLSAMDEPEIARRVTRAAALRPPGQRVALEAVMTEVGDIRRLGFSRSLDRVVPGAGIVCVLLPRAVHEHPVALGIGGLSSVLLERTEDLVDLLRARIARHLGT